MGILKKVHFYKRALQILIALNIGIITAGTIAGISYYGSKHMLGVLMNQNIERLRLLEEIQSEIMTLATLPPQAPTHRHIKHVEALRAKLALWKDSSLIQIPENETQEPVRFSSTELRAMNDRISKEKLRLTTQVHEAGIQMSDLTSQLIWLAVFTFLFGVVIPILVFKKLTQELNRAKIKAEENISQWIANWLQAHQSHGDKPFQDPIFWLKIILVTFETFAPQSRNTIMQFFSEFAPILRKELESDQESKAKLAKRSA